MNDTTSGAVARVTPEVAPNMPMKGRKRSASLLDMIAEEEIVAETQPSLLDQGSKTLTSDSSTTEEWEPIKKHKRKRRKTNAEYKDRARESTTLRWMKHCCAGREFFCSQ